ncbi:MAG: SH3 domain-containing protein [Chloroflexi bacterium]|nr:SH3 domain-containing protein [Chloroflexota bacterium]
MRRLTSMFLKYARRTLAIGFTLLTAAAVAQNPPADVCETIVRDALQAANTACLGTARNQVCYGNILGAASPADGVSDLIFQDVGDIATLAQIKALELSPLNEADHEWGVALMQIQANLPDTLPGQNVTFLLFGDTTVEQTVGEQVRIDAATTDPSNMRLGPNTTSPVIGSVPEGSAVVATGKTTNAAGEEWVRVRYEDYRTQTGWMLASLLDVELDSLPDVASGSLNYNPMQAFYFRTGIGRTTCATAPVNGVVVQTPQGAGRVNFNVNGINVALGSTVFITAPEGSGSTCLSLITGGMELSSGGASLDLVPGERSCVPVIEEDKAGPPGPAVPFDATEIASIAAVLDILPLTVEIPPPAPRRTPTPRPPTQTPVPAVQPTSALSEPGGGGGSPLPTSTPDPVNPRFIDVNRNRRGAVVDFSVTAGPDAPSSITWSLSDSTQSGPNVTIFFGAGATYSVGLAVCWSDGECRNRTVDGQIPPCPIDFSQAAPIQLIFDGSTQRYQVFKTDEACAKTFAGNFGDGFGNFGGTAHIGETWEVQEVPAMNVVWGTFVGDASPITVTIPGTGAPRSRFSLRQSAHTRR